MPILRPGSQVKITQYGKDGEPARVVTGYLKQIDLDHDSVSFRRIGRHSDSVSLGGFMEQSDLTLTVALDSTVAYNEAPNHTSEEDDMTKKFIIIRDEARKAVNIHCRIEDAEDGTEQYLARPAQSDGSNEVLKRPPLSEMPLYAQYDEDEFKALLRAARSTPGLWDAAREDFAR
jgi:hypothetical protein